jgi:hypothetical protein
MLSVNCNLPVLNTSHKILNILLNICSYLFLSNKFLSYFTKQVQIDLLFNGNSSVIFKSQFKSKKFKTSSMTNSIGGHSIGLHSQSRCFWDVKRETRTSSFFSYFLFVDWQWGGSKTNNTLCSKGQTIISLLTTNKSFPFVKRVFRQ